MRGLALMAAWVSAMEHVMNNKETRGKVGAGHVMCSARSKQEKKHMVSDANKSTSLSNEKKLSISKKKRTK